MKAGACSRCVLLVAFTACLIRLLFRVPVHPNPPDVEIVVGTDGWADKLQKCLSEHGYAHVRGLLQRTEVATLRDIANNYCYGTERKALPLSYGGYSVPAFLDLPEFSAAKWLMKDARLHRLLEAAFNGTWYRFAAHNDVGCDFVGVWHKDVLRGLAAKFQECDVWSPDEEGQTHEIYKVMFYLQDHATDELAMKVIPGSHVLPRTPWETGYVAAHPVMGDAFIFDQRISHAGNTHYQPWGQGRLFMQVGFGRTNRFTDQFERGTVERQQSLQVRMLQSKTVDAFGKFVADAKFTVLGAVMTILPPHLLNHFADRDVGSHNNKRCSNEAATATRPSVEL